jgi:DNA-binding transcriptional LysR family regulator
MKPLRATAATPSELPSSDDLRCFLQAAKALSFRKAARAVALTPSAFSARIRLLEERIGEPLFRRTTRSVALTLAGLALQPKAEAALAAAEACVLAVRGELQIAVTSLTIGSRHELAMSWLLPALDRLSAELHGARCDLYVGSGADLRNQLRTGELDLAVASVRLGEPKLDDLPLHREDYAFVGAPKLLQETPFRRAADAKGHVLLDSTRELPLFRDFRNATRRARAIASHSRASSASAQSRPSARAPSWGEASPCYRATTSSEIWGEELQALLSSRRARVYITLRPRSTTRARESPRLRRTCRLSGSLGHCVGSRSPS